MKKHRKIKRMSKSYFHIECHKRDNPGSQATGFESWYAGRCASCNNTYPVGEMITSGVRGRPAGVKRPPTAAPSTAIVATEADAPATAAPSALMAEFEALRAEITAAKGRIATLETAANGAVKQECKAEEIGRQHSCFPTLLACATARVNAWLAGPAGSGKTTAARNVARALALPFYFTGAVASPVKLMGHFDLRTGKVVRTAFREAFEHGGVFLWDEVDASCPNALLSFNAALDNGICDFPDGTIAAHPDFIVIAAANTWGSGPNAEYVGRNRIDGATLNRYATIAWTYDEDLETHIVADHPLWVKRVQTVRARVQRDAIKVIVSPRASIAGAKLLRQGLTQEVVEALVLRREMTQAQWDKVGY